MEMQNDTTTKRTANRRRGVGNDVAGSKGHGSNGRMGRRKVKQHIHCELNGQPPKAPYHYTECGLDDVYLLSGYDVEDSNHGEIVRVQYADELHNAIGEFLVRNKKILTGMELRFLRNQMDLTQAELGKLLGLTDQAVARWEKNKTDITGPADYLIRVLFVHHIGMPKGMDIRDLLTALEEQDSSRDDEKQVFERNSSGWQPTTLAA